MKKGLYISITIVAWFLLAGAVNGVSVGNISPLKGILLCMVYGAIGLLGAYKSGAFNYN